MQVYAVTLLCLTSLISLISLDAWRLRNHSSYVRDIEQYEEFVASKSSAYAESIYPDTVRRLANDKSYLPITNHEKKTIKISKSKKKQQYRSLSVPFSRPPNHSRLNIYAFLSEQPEDRKETSSWYEILSRLIQRVYIDTGHFPCGTQTLIVNALLEKKEEIIEGAQVQGEDVLSVIRFPDTVSDIMYHMLKGSEHYPSLLNFLHYEKKSLTQCKLNLFFMDPLLLEVVINHPDAYRQISQLREDILNKVKHQEQEIQNHRQAAVIELFKTRTDFRVELRENIEIILSQHNLFHLLNKKRFDYTLGSAGDYLFVTNPYTHIDSRVRCSLKPKNISTYS